MRDDAHLEIVVVESVVEYALSGVLLQPVSDIAQQTECLLGEILIKKLIKPSSGASVVERAKPGFLFEKLVAISKTDEGLEVAKRDRCVLLAMTFTLS